MTSVGAFEQFTVEPNLTPRGAVSNSLAAGDQYRAQPSELTAADIQTIVKLHNDVRARYGVAPLQWDSGLASSAKQWADTCYWGHHAAARTKSALGGDYFPPPKQMGENLSVWMDRRSTKLAGQYGTDLWLNEEKDFDCSTGQCIPGRMCGHFTQQVWAGTQRIGCALRTCEDGVDKRSWPSSVEGIKNVKYLVCKYDPPGNFTGQRPFPIAQCSQPGLKTAPTKKSTAVIIDQTKVTKKEAERTIDQTPTRNTQYRLRRQPVIPPTTPAAGTNAAPPQPQPQQPSAPSGTGDFFARLRPGSGTTTTTPTAPIEPPTTLTPRPGFVPEGIELVRIDTPVTKVDDQKKEEEEQKEQEKEEAAANNTPANNANENANTNAQNTDDDNKSTSEPLPPAPEPPLTQSSMPAPTPTVLPTAGLSLVGAGLLGAAVGALWYVSETQRAKKSDVLY